MATLYEYLEGLNIRVPPTAAFPGGVLTSGSGAPDVNVSPFYMFYKNTTNGDIYWPTEQRDGWELGLAGTVLTDGEQRLKADTS